MMNNNAFEKERFIRELGLDQAISDQPEKLNFVISISGHWHRNFLILSGSLGGTGTVFEGIRSGRNGYFDVCIFIGPAL
jgi:hypothetical protein